MAFRSAETKFLFVSSLLVLLVGVKAVTSILEPPAAPSSLASATSAASPTARQPSSIAKSEVKPSAVSATGAKTAGTAHLDFSCRKEEAKELAIKGSLLQIRGRDCKSPGGSSQITIINKSNGYTASVFVTGPEEFRTDLIQLVEGANQITIEYSNSNGKKFEKQVIVKSTHI